MHGAVKVIEYNKCYLRGTNRICMLLCFNPGSSSSYGGDSEDSDWAPPPVVPTGGGTADDSDGEDIGELLSEAKDFLSNKKMRK